MRTLLLALLAVFGLAMGVVGVINNTWVDAGLMALLGLGNGYVTIMLFTWIQTRTPRALLGRMMSLLTLSSAGLVPISQALAGSLGAWNVTLLFGLAGGCLLLLTIWTAVQPALVTFSDSLAANA
jgi:hypothetical protein